MTDVHTVSARLDTSSFEKLETSLKETARAGRQADAAVEGVASGTQRAGAGARSMASGTRQAASATQNMGAQARAATGSLNSMGAAMRQVNAHGQAYARTSSTAGFATANLAAQFNDIGVMMASGQSPLLLAAQQGTQINQVLTQMRSTGQSTGRALVTAFTSIISPMSILTIGVIAGGAALFQWAQNALFAGEGSKSLEDRLDELEDRLSGARQATDDAIQSNKDLAESFGSAAAGMRGFLEELRQERLQEMRQSIVDIVGALERMATLPTVTVPAMPRHTSGTGSGTFFDQIMGDMVEGAIGGRAGRMPPPAWPSAREEALNRMTQAYEAARQEAERLETTDQRRLDLMRDHMLPAAQALLEARGGEDEALQETIKALQTAVTRQATLVGLTEKTVEVDKERARELERIAKAQERDAEWARDRIMSAEQELRILEARLDYGENSAEHIAAQKQVAHEVLEAEIERRDLNAEIAEKLRDANSRLITTRDLVRRVAEEERERERLAREAERARERMIRESAAPRSAGPPRDGAPARAGNAPHGRHGGQHRQRLGRFRGRRRAGLRELHRPGEGRIQEDAVRHDRAVGGEVSDEPAVRRSGCAGLWGGSAAGGGRCTIRCRHRGLRARIARPSACRRCPWQLD